MSLLLRDCTEGDCGLLFAWVNDKDVRKNSINKETVIFDEHTKWFGKRINSETCKIFILCSDNMPIGQIRFELNDENEWTIDYSVASEFRGKGYGKLIVELGIDKLENSGHPIAAIVNVNNISSGKVFKSLNFKEISTVDINDEKYIKFLKEK